MFQQYVVDIYNKIEVNNLNYHMTHQENFRRDTYGVVMDAIDQEEKLTQIGTRVFLPSTFEGSRRNMHFKFMNAMAIIRHYGKPSFFITITCNPNWHEIKNSVEDGQSANDRPDIVARAFKLYLTELMNDFIKNECM